MPRSPAHRVLAARRALGYAGFLLLGVVALAFATKARVGGASLFGPPLYGLGVAGLLCAALYHRALPRFRGESKVTTWLYGIATKTVLMHLRSRRRHRRLVEALEVSAMIEPQHEESIERSVESRRELARVWRCLMRIKPKKRVVFVLHEIEGMSGKQIAQALDIKEATVWTRLFHARKELFEGLRRGQKR